MFKQNPLSSLSDSQIINRLDTLVQKERETTLEVLCHIIEMDRRSLYLGRGYASLFEYCTRHLGYSESAASRRIKTARCIRDFPEVYEMLAKNEMNLSTVSKLSGILNENNKNELLEEVRFQSARKVDAIIARIRPLSMLRERVKPVYIKKSPIIPTRSITSDNDSKAAQCRSESACESGRKFTADVGGKKLATGSSAQKQGSVLEQKFKLEFAVSSGFMKKLEVAKALLSKKHPRGVSFETLFEALLDEYLEKYNPAQKIQRREKRRAKKNGKQDKSSKVKKTRQAGTLTAANTENKTPKNSKRSRHIPQAIRDKVFTRDRGKCTFVGPGGVRCNSTWNLEIDHIKPFARGGDHSIYNFRLLCAKHNHHEAERIYGRSFMERHRNKASSIRK
jgi:hypothetical protein